MMKCQLQNGLTLIADSFDTFTERTGDRPKKIVMSRQTLKSISVEDVMRGHVLTLFDVPVQIRNDCPTGCVYFM